MADNDATTNADERRRLVAELDLERNQLHRNIEWCRIRDIEQPFIGAWSLKEIIAHVESCEAEAVGKLHDARTSAHPDVVAEAVGRAMAWECDASPTPPVVPFWTLLEQLSTTREALRVEVAAAPDDEIANPVSPVRELIDALIEHDRRHWHDIAAKLAGMQGARHAG